VARLHDPESRALDDLPALVRELREHLESIETPLANVTTEWKSVLEIKPEWRLGTMVMGLPTSLRKALDALLPEKGPTHE
jgi:hypothetical protein